MTVFTNRLTTADGFVAEISSLGAPRSVADLADHVGFLMISIKNRLFTNALIKAYCRFAIEHLAGGFVTVVDRPYIHNVVAALPDPSASARQMNGIRRLAEDRRQQVQKIIDTHDRGRVEFMSWDDLATQTPQWLEAEFRAAFENLGQLRSDVLEQTRRMSGALCDQAELERRSLFLVEETPALLYSYYLFRGGIADFYPGELANYFWRIERGDYAEELPRITELATTHQGLIYVTFRDGRR